ncbi:MAG: hypothetical protein L6Q97_17150 [Thermoanaerobaculia bacterium]|nr:hypothetical protein [Thermoanaerobaculia bacterium]
MIKELNDLAHFIKTSVWRDEELLSVFSVREPELLELYRLLWHKNLGTDEAAARAAGWSLSAYKIRARRLRKCLRDMAVLFDDEKARANAMARNQVEGILETAIMNLLQTRGYRHAPPAIAKRLFRRGVDYDAPVFAVEGLGVLKETVKDTGSEKQFITYNRLYWEYRAHADAEARAADCFQWAALPGLRKQSERRQFLEHTRQRLEALAPFKGKTPSYLFHLHYFTVQAQFLLESGDYEGALRCCDEAIAWFVARRYPVAGPLAMFHYKKVPAYILLKRFEAGETAALAGLDYAPDGSDDFFLAYEMYFCLAMHAGQYEQALDIFQTVSLHKRFSQLQGPLREIWHMLGAYLFLAYRFGHLPLPEKSLPVFKSHRFINDMPAFSRDKEGINVAILIAHLLLQLLEGKTDQLLERVQALDKYRERYLRYPEAERPGLFIKVLTLLPKVNFSAVKFQKKAAPLLRQIAALPRRMTNPAHEPEIIPFENLAEMIANWLAIHRLS